MSLLLGFAAYLAHKGYQGLKTDEKLKHLSPEEYERQYQTYLDSAGLKLGLKNTDSFNNYADRHINTLEKLSQMKSDADKSDKDKKPDFLLRTPDGKTIVEKLEANSRIAGDNNILVTNAGVAMKNAFKEALELSPETIEARNTYNDDITAVNRLIEKSPVFNTASIGSYLNEQGKNAHDKIESQHKEEIRKIKAMFRIPGQADIFADKAGKPPFDDTENPELENIILALGFDSTDTNHTALKAFAKDLVNALEKSHKAELEKFDQSIKDEVSHLHRVAQAERDRIGYLATMYNLSPTMKAQIDDRHSKNKKEKGFTVQMENDSNGNSQALFKGIEVKDLEILETMTGRLIKKTSEGKYTMDLPGLGLLYYHGLADNVAYDFACASGALRAMGYTKITWTMNYPKDPEYSLVLARKQYEGSLKAGFAPSDITIQVYEKDEKTGKLELITKTTEQLFGGEHSVRLQSLHAAYEKDTQKRKTYREQLPSGTNLKAQTEKLREAIKEERNAVPEIEPDPKMVEEEIPAQVNNKI